MRVRSTKSKRINANISRIRRRLHWSELSLHAQAQLLKVNRRIRLLEMETRRKFSMLQHQGRFDKSGDTRCRFCVANIGLY